MNLFFLRGSILIATLHLATPDLNAQDKQAVINVHLDNYRIREIYEDTTTFSTRNIFSVRHYKTKERPEKGSVVKTIAGKPLVLASYTEYLPDGRKRYKQYEYDQIDREEHYHYDSGFINLLLAERSEDHKVFYYSWLFYDKNANIREDFEYRIYGENFFDFQALLRYDVKQEDGKTRVDIKEYGYDTLADPTETYTFAYPYKTRFSPQYQSRNQEFKLIGGTYKPVATKGFVFDDRTVQYTYDDKGFITSEVWHKPAGHLENRTEYSYSNDYRERVEQAYHMLGTEKSTRTTRKYDDRNNLVFEQSIEYTGNPLGIRHYEYVYDKQGNWTEKREYYQSCDKGVYGRKELKSVELREISYYQAGQQPRSFSLPAFPERATVVKEDIPRLSAQKQQGIDAFNTAVSSGAYDKTIKLQTAKNLDEFTPPHWQRVDTASGDLDQIPGDEIAIVYKTPIEGESGFKHCLAIFKKENNKWQLWHQTTSPILEDRAGGMMGNPFDGIKIERRCVVIGHFGGSRDKWNYTHRYRFQNNNWYLIGASVSAGAPCDYWMSLDYNLSTGDAEISSSHEVCDEDTQKETSSWTEKIKLKKPLPLMDSFVPGDTKIRLVKRDFDIYY